MADSLVIGNIIELLGGGVPSTHPLCEGAIFYLAPGWDLSAPQPSTDTVASLLLGGGLPLGEHVANRTPTFPIAIRVPPTGNIFTDRSTLAGAREVLMQAVNADRWQLVWTREGGAGSMLLDCFHAAPSVVTYSQIYDKSLVSLVSVSFEALPYGRSDSIETINFNSPSTGWQAPPSSVTIDDFNTTDNYLSANDSGFETSIGNWVSVTNCAVSRSTAQAHTGTASMLMNSSAAGNMLAESASAGNAPTVGLPCLANDTINVKGWSKAGATGRTVQPGAQFYDSVSGTAVGTVVLATGTADVTTGFTAINGSVTAPANSVTPGALMYAVAAYQVNSTAAANEQHFIDDVSLDRGPIFSAADLALFSQSSTVAVGSKSLRWARSVHDCPNYVHTLPAALDVTNRKRMSLWVGLGTATYSQWHTGRATAAITLFDAGGNSVTVSITFTANASGLITAPKWQKISGLIPQTTMFDYTTVSSYVLQLWNKVETGGVEVLQAEAYFDHLAADAASTGTNGTRGAVYAIPGVVGTAPAPLSLQLQPGPSVVPTSVTFTATGSNTWTSTLSGNVYAECWGAGSGGAGGADNADGGGGGAGGEYSADFIPVTNTTVYHPTVGAGSAGGTHTTRPSAAGGDSFFTGDSSRTCRAHGATGAGTSSNNKLGARGGTGSTNLKHNDGGDGKTIGSGAPRGGGGGGSGGTDGPGLDATNAPTNEWTGAPAVNGGGPGGNGGREPNTPHTGNAPSSGPGGGGGGGAVHSGTGQTAGNGANGQIRLSYSSTAGSALKTAILHLPPRDVPNSFAPLIVTGNGADTPNGGTTYTAPLTGSQNARYKGTHQVILTSFTWNTPASSRTITWVLTQHKGDGTTTSVTLTRTLTPNTDPDTLRVLNGIVLLGTVTLPLADISPGNNTDTFTITVASSNTSDRFLDSLLLPTEGQTVIYSTAGSGVNNFWLTEPDIGLDVSPVFGSAADWDTANSVLTDCPVVAGGPMALVPGENPLLVYSVQGAPAVIASYQPRWWIDRLQ